MERQEKPNQFAIDWFLNNHRYDSWFRFWVSESHEAAKSDQPLSEWLESNIDGCVVELWNRGALVYNVDDDGQDRYEPTWRTVRQVLEDVLRPIGYPSDL